MPTNPHYEAVLKRVIECCPEFSVEFYPQKIYLNHVFRVPEFNSINPKLDNTEKWLWIMKRESARSDLAIAAPWDLTKDYLEDQSPLVWEALDKMLSV